MLLRKISLCLLTIVLSFSFSQNSLQAQEEIEEVGNYEHFEFLYRIDSPLFQDPEADVIRDVIPSNEYEERKRFVIQTVLVPMFIGLLDDDNTLALEYGFEEEIAGNLALLDDDMSERIRDNPELATEMAEKMAEWTFFYNQYDLWNRYVKNSVLREELRKDEISEYIPQNLEAEIDTIYQSMLVHADEVRQAEELRFADMVDVVKGNKQSQERYDNFLADADQDTIAYAKNWGRQYDGTVFNMDGTMYLVRSIEDRPDNPDQDLMKESLPENGILLEVPKGKFVTPYDLINDDGSIREPQGN